MSQNSSIEDRFKNLIANTYCPFAKDAKIMYSLDWDLGVDLNKNIDKVLPQFVYFVTNGISDGYELFVTEVR